jgi:hypothetical protein
MNMALIEDDAETQQKGTVCIVYQSNPLTKILQNREERAMVRRLLSCIPMRFSGCHMCLPDSLLFSLVKPVVLAAAVPSIRTRFRFHKGKRKNNTKRALRRRVLGISCAGTIEKKENQAAPCICP